MLNVKKLLTKILTLLLPTNMFMVTYHESSAFTTAANTNQDGTLTLTNAGYYPLGIVGYHSYWLSGSTATLNWYSLHMTEQSVGSCKVTYAVRNTNAQSVGWKLCVRILWAKAGS